MILAQVGWQDVRDFSRDAVVLIPTGSLEQHGPHLPLFTDSLLVTAVAESVEKMVPGQVLLTPTLWLGASGHHMAFPGSLTATFSSYIQSLIDVVTGLNRHGFHRFFVLNGHGGNTDPNGVALRQIKDAQPNLTIGYEGYYHFIPEALLAEVMEGPIKGIRHSCEAEVSLMMHLHPDLVRVDRLRDDGLEPDPPVEGMIHHFDELTEEGSLGYATLASAEKGRRLFEAAVFGSTEQIRRIAEGYVLRGIAQR